MTDTKIQTFEERVKAKLQADIADLIPEDQLSELVRQQLNHFINNKLPKMVDEELEKTLRTAIVRELDTPEWKAQWAQDSQQQLSDMVVKTIADNAHVMMANMMAGQMSQMLLQLRNQLYNQGINVLY